MNNQYSTSQYHAYSLPVSLLETLIPRNLGFISKTPPRSASPVGNLPPASVTSATNARACNICLGATFADVDSQRNHFRSDWHRYNVKLRLDGRQPVAEADFTQLLDDLEDSISGSASSSDESDSNDSDAINVLMKKAKRVVDRSPSPTTRVGPQTAIAWFHSPPATQIGIYKALLPKSAEPSSYLAELKNMQIPRENGRMWAMFMVAGGHFAGAIVRVSWPDQDEGDDNVQGKKKKPKRPRPDTDVIKHKTFHRYTTRRKQGGSQSLNDNAKGPAKSAGALLRRYGEQALRDDIRNLLEEWAEELDACERVWIRASGTNRKIFMDYDGALLTKADDRLRTFPFPTRRPTQSELSRCLNELTRVKISHLTEEALREQDEAYLASLPKPKPVPIVKTEQEPEKPKQPVLSKEEQVFREKWIRLLDMVNRGRLEALKSFWERESISLGGINALIPEWTGEKRGTLLQVAAHAGQGDVVQWLLVDVNADPTIEVPLLRSGEPEEVEEGRQSDGSDALLPVAKGARRTAYDIARNRGVRDVFRRCAADDPDKWDWLGAAHVPSVLSKEKEEERDEKKKIRRKGLKEKVKEREARDRDRDREKMAGQVVEEVKKEVKMQDPSAPRRLGGSSGAADAIAGLTPEMRARVERERRARAAEARLKALSGS